MRRVLFLMFVTLVGVAGACGVNDPSPEEISRMPEAQLLFPGASVQSTRGDAGQRGGLMAAATAPQLIKTFAATASIDDVVAFYSTELDKAGWDEVHATNVGGYTAEHRWEKGELALILWFVAPVGSPTPVPQQSQPLSWHVNILANQD